MHYGIPAGTETSLVQKLKSILPNNFHSVFRNLFTRSQRACFFKYIGIYSQFYCVDLITLDDDFFGVEATERGRIMAHYCISFQTVSTNKLCFYAHRYSSFIVYLPSGTFAASKLRFFMLIY